LLIIWNFVRPPRLAFDPGSWMFLVAWALIAIAFAITNQPGRTDFLLAVNFAMFALYPMLSGALQRFAGPNNVAQVAVMALIGSFAALGVATFQVFVEGLSRAQGYGSNPIPSATIALFLGFFALAGLFSISGPRRYVFLLGPIAGVATVLLAQSRGPLVALPLLALIALVMVPIRRIVLVGAVVAVIVAGGVAYAVKPELFGRIASLPQMAIEIVTGAPVSAETDMSGNVRYRIFEGSIEAFTHSPWVGYGWYMKVPVVEKYIEDPVGFGDPTYAHLHSDILNFGVSAGIVGLFAYLLVLMAPIVSALRSSRDSQFKARLFLALNLSAGFACCGAVNLLFGFEFMTTMYVVLAAIFIAYCRDKPALATDR
jgi:O-antigen ligase